MSWLDPVLYLLTAACLVVALMLFASCFAPEIAAAWRKVRGWFSW